MDLEFILPFLLLLPVILQLTVAVLSIYWLYHIYKNTKEMAEITSSMPYQTTISQ